LGRGSNAGNAFGSLRALFGFSCNCNSNAGKASVGNVCTSNASASDPSTSNAGTSDPPSDRANASNACTSGGRALTLSSEFSNSSLAITLAATLAASSAFAFAFALACFTKGANSCSNSELEEFVDLSILELLKLESLF
jgi:hypothetical protein